METKKSIILGASSFIGRAIYDNLSNQGIETIGTYCNSPREKLKYFDLREPDLKGLDIDLSKIKRGVICSAITRPDDCFRDPQGSSQINVQGTKRLIEQFWDLEIFPILFSSEYVFNGETGYYDEEDKKSPNTVYGNQKAEVEDFLLSSGREFLIARLGKVFGLNPGDKTIITSTAEQLQQGKTVKCAIDQIFCPTYVGDLVHILDLALEKGLNGLYNLASPKAFSRFELAHKIKSKLEIKTGEIVSCSINDLDFLDNRPFDTSLNSREIIDKTGFIFTSIDECLEELKQEYNKE